MDGFDLTGKVAVVTGASSGIGAATAISFAGRGATVVLVGRSVERLKAVEARARGLGAGAIDIVSGDVGDALVMRDVVTHTVREFGKLDIVFANAGIVGPTVPFADYPDDAFEQVLATDLRGVYLTIKHSLRVMARQRSGSIIATGSLGSERGLPTTVAYNVAKHAVLGMVRTAAVEYASVGVRINAVIPGIIDTPLMRGLLDGATGGDPDARAAMLAGSSPAGRAASAQEVADVVTFLASDMAGFVNGAAWTVDGGAYAWLGSALRDD